MCEKYLNIESMLTLRYPTKHFQQTRKPQSFIIII